MQDDDIYPAGEWTSVEEEAAAWLIRLDGDAPLSEEELGVLKEWTGRSPAHRKALADMNRFWGNNILTELSVPLVNPGKIKERTVRRSRVWYAAVSYGDFWCMEAG